MYRKNIHDDQRRRCSDIIIDTLLSYLDENHGLIKYLLSYRSLPSEVNSETLFHLPNYHVFAPITHHHDDMEWHLVTPQTGWRRGLFGVSEPTSGTAWSGGRGAVLICPLVAFDRRGNRLGMGKGCFDYWLASHRNELSQVIGLAFSGQEVAEIAAEGHDAPMDVVITEKEVIKCPKH